MDALDGKIPPELNDFKDKLRELYNAPYARDAGIGIESLSPECMSLYLDIQPKHISSRGFVHGAAIYALTDHTLAFASGYDEDCVAQNISINYYRPLKEGHLVSRSRLINKSKTLKVYEIDTFCNGKLITSAICTAFRLGDYK